ncbi:sensor histidine kinase [Thalassotalea marina]|uniref:histidine kinase n=1 Tax=Thalassotalea marina TaxID=1673741 RepID=A0A919BRD8_9GAMM|nr:ATP-binding protein [Thalassotalea marina]GHG07473.1 histidine kinase [Thalassotalea marina]
MRPNSSTNSGALAELNQAITLAVDQLREQRLVSKEHHLALSKVLEHIDIAVLCFDEHGIVTLANPKAKKLLNHTHSEMVGFPARTLGIDNKVLSAKQQKLVQLTTSHTDKKVYLQTDNYQLYGKTYTLLFINDVQQILQNEERAAWQKLLRVLSHEINNSLAPIASIGESLNGLLEQQQLQDIEQDLKDGLTIMTKRALALNGFIKEYQMLAKLPEPKKSLFSLVNFIQEQLALFPNVTPSISTKTDFEIFADREQLSQTLVNLIKNAMEANQTKTQAHIEISWQINRNTLQLMIADNGPGIANPDNLFVPFYTTKKTGSGIGLVVSRQILFNHGGDLTLRNKENEQGAIATISLPVINNN